MSGHYVDPDYHHMTADPSECECVEFNVALDTADHCNNTDDEMKPLLQQQEFIHYTQQTATDFVTLTPSSAVAYDNAPAAPPSHFTYTQLQPL